MIISGEATNRSLGGISVNWGWDNGLVVDSAELMIDGIGVTSNEKVQRLGTEDIILTTTTLDNLNKIKEAAQSIFDEYNTSWNPPVDPPVAPGCVTREEFDNLVIPVGISETQVREWAKQLLEDKGLI